MDCPRCVRDDRWPVAQQEERVRDAPQPWVLNVSRTMRFLGIGICEEVLTDCGLLHGRNPRALQAKGGKGACSAWARGQGGPQCTATGRGSTGIRRNLLLRAVSASPALRDPHSRGRGASPSLKGSLATEPLTFLPALNFLAYFDEAKRPVGSWMFLDSLRTVTMSHIWLRPISPP